jgi:hypothetical protein
MRSAGIRSTMKGGLAKIEDVSADTLVAYAAKAGSVSYDGDGVNSPYATALIRHLAEPGLDIRIALGRVRDEVVSMTGGRQEPFIYGSLGGATIPLVPAPAAKKIELAPAAVSKLEPPTAVGVSPAMSPPPSNLVGNLAPSAAAALAKVEPAKPLPPPARAVADPSVACNRDEQRLERLRADPSRDEVARFQRELSCVRLKAQVQRLFESVATGPRQPAPPIDSAPKVAPAQQAQAQPIPAGDTCARDAERLARLRADPNVDAITRFERELGCEYIRPQLRRLRESLGL